MLRLLTSLIPHCASWRDRGREGRGEEPELRAREARGDGRDVGRLGVLQQAVRLVQHQQRLRLRALPGRNLPAQANPIEGWEQKVR